VQWLGYTTVCQRGSATYQRGKRKIEWSRLPLNCSIRNNWGKYKKKAVKKKKGIERLAEDEEQSSKCGKVQYTKAAGISQLLTRDTNIAYNAWGCNSLPRSLKASSARHWIAHLPYESLGVIYVHLFGHHSNAILIFHKRNDRIDV